MSTALVLNSAPAATSVRLDGTVAHPVRPALVRTAPDGAPIAVLPVHQLGSPTWVPVIARRGDWVRVLLPSRPNGSSGWIRDGAGQLELARSASAVQVDLSGASMSIRTAGRPTRSWPVVVGARDTPTPRGTTFVMAAVDDPGSPYSRYLMPLGWHSDTLDSFGGGPGTVALHGWPDQTIFTMTRRARSHGCIRVPEAAMAEVRSLPLGTPVVIT